MTQHSLFPALAAVLLLLSACAAHDSKSAPENPTIADASFTPQTGAVHEYQLENGLKLIVKEDHRSPVVVSQVWYKVGSSYEYNGITGVSHVLEHMMFQGTEKYGPGEASRLVSENGGRENAFTSSDYTAYFQLLEQSRLPISFELEADRMRNLLLREEEFAKEVQVVMEERRMRTDDDPQSLTYEQLLAAAYLNSPYRNPVIGWMNDLQNLKLTDVQRWYDAWYAPNNAIVVVVGDVNPRQVHRLAEQYFGPLPARDVPTVKPQQEIEQRGIRRINVKAPAELPILIMAYKVPVLNTTQEDWEPYALDMLAGILDGGASARFARHLIRGDQIAAQASIGYDPYDRLTSLFTVSGTPARERSVSELEQAIRAQLDRVRSEPVDAIELERIKIQVVAANEYQKDSIFYQARQIGALESVGLDWQVADQYVERLRAVTAEQVQAVARKYLVDENLTIATLDPQPGGARIAAGEQP